MSHPALSNSTRSFAALHDTTTSYAGLRTNHRYQALVFMGAWLGPRCDEAIGLRICDVNPLRHELTFGRVVINQNGSRTFTKIGSRTGLADVTRSALRSSAPASTAAALPG